MDNQEMFTDVKSTVPPTNRNARARTAMAIGYFALSAVGCYWVVNVMPSGTSVVGLWVGTILSVNFGISIFTILVWAHARQVGVVQSFADVVSALLFIGIGAVVDAIIIPTHYTQIVVIILALSILPFTRSVRPASVKLTQSLFHLFGYKASHHG